METPLQASPAASPPPPPPPPPSSPPPVPSGPSMPKIPLDLDPRTMATIKWSAIWNGVGGAIKAVAGYLSFFFIGGLAGDLIRTFGGVTNNFPVGKLIQNVLWGAIYGAVFGFLISKFYPQIQQWNRQYLKGWLNTFFKLLFYPSLVGSVLAYFMMSVSGFGIGFMPLLVILAGMLVSSFLYAKMMTKYVGPLYPPPL